LEVFATSTTMVGRHAFPDGKPVNFPSSPLPNDKSALRQVMLERRKTVVDPILAADRLCDWAWPHLSALCQTSPSHAPVVAAYWPIRGEIDPLPLLARCAQAGAVTALPVVIGPDQPLLFRRWNPDLSAGDALERGSFGTRQPLASAPEVLPSLLLIPLVAFDRHGQRLGYGGGFYDRTLARLRQGGTVHAIGLAHTVQQIEAVPCGPHDQPLDLVFTESETFSQLAASTD
jgi:5-formyltetrahydrofolate cyclo-ligase